MSPCGLVYCCGARQAGGGGGGPFGSCPCVSCQSKCQSNWANGPSQDARVTTESVGRLADGQTGARSSSPVAAQSTSLSDD